MRRPLGRECRRTILTRPTPPTPRRIERYRTPAGSIRVRRERLGVVRPRHHLARSGRSSSGRRRACAGVRRCSPPLIPARRPTCAIPCRCQVCDGAGGGDDHDGSAGASTDARTAHRAARSDPRIVGLLNDGSHSRGQADEWSDLDVSVFLRDEDFEAFTQTWVGWAS